MWKRELRFLLLLGLAFYRSGMVGRSVVDGSHATTGWAEGCLA